MKNTPVVILALLVGFGLGFFVAYQRWHKQPGTLDYWIDPPTKKEIPHVHDGDTLQWPAKVSFQYGGGLCVGSEKKTSTCVVKQGIDKLPPVFFTILCDGGECTDPDFGGGSDQLGQMGSAAASGASAPATLAPLQIHLYCDSNVTKVDPIDNSANPVMKGQGIYWVPNGPQSASWTAGPDLSPVCGVSTFSNPGTPCTVLSTAPARTSYNVTLPNCQNNAVTAYVNVQQ